MSQIQLDDKQLWGNEAADDEDPIVLNAYFVYQPSWAEFFDIKVPLSIARARKGMGKSAILRECGFRTSKSDDALVIEVKGADLVAQMAFKTLTPVEHVYDWQQRICALINRRIGASIGFACNDDSIALVEAAELSGYKSRNIIGVLVDRLKGKIGPAELKKLGIIDNKAILDRFLGTKMEKVLLLIDDIDSTFTNTPEECLRLSTFFSACRQIASSFTGISIRTVIRSNVWATIKRTDEALDKVEQYIFDINWSQKGYRAFLAERISAYCERTERGDLLKGKSKEQIIELIFEKNFPWGHGKALPHRVIKVYSGGRPRWAAQLCRMAGVEALKVRDSHIKFGHIKSVLEAYGRFRLDDIEREHRHQCDRITEMVNAFAKQKATYPTNKLMPFISEKILSKLKPLIDGTVVSDELSIARYLFRVGFILALGQDDRGHPEYFQYEEMPELLSGATNVDHGMVWRVHPAFHGALGLAD